jgi:GT2 family glycosyltransferase
VTEPLVVTVILNTNRKDDTLACLTSLAESTYPRVHTMVLDNASTDGSVEAIVSNFPGIEIVHLGENLGYAGNNNVGIALAMERGADWVLVLNEDTILAPECIQRLVDTGESDALAGMVGPLVLHADEPGVIQSAGGFLTRRWDAVHIGQNQDKDGQFTEPRNVDWLSGCALLVRRQMIESVGMLDEQFFYYWEEVDWCLRSRSRGWTLVHEPRAELWHKGVQRDYEPTPNVAYYNTRNRLLLMHKHRAPISARVATTLHLVRTALSMSIRPRWRTSRPHRNALLQGWSDYHLRRLGMRKTS